MELTEAVKEHFPLGSDFRDAEKFFLTQNFEYRYVDEQNSLEVPKEMIHYFSYREKGLIPILGKDCSWIVGIKEKYNKIYFIESSVGCLGI